MENKCLVDVSPISKDELTTPSSVEEATVVLEEYALTGQDQPPDQPPATRILVEEAGTLNTRYLYIYSRGGGRSKGAPCAAPKVYPVPKRGAPTLKREDEFTRPVLGNAPSSQIYAALPQGFSQPL